MPTQAPTTRRSRTQAPAVRRRLRVGLLVNPIAGVGGAAGFKGSDHEWRRALDEGYEPPAPARAQRFAEAIGSDVEWLTCPGAMGVAGLPVAPGFEGPAKGVGQTSAADTARCARSLGDAGVDLLVFVGGDGTATDVAQAVDAALPCLGVPAGVKVTSAVFAHDVAEAAWLVDHLGPGFETLPRDVTDLDEEAYRRGELKTRLTGSLNVPVSPLVQGGKMAMPRDTPMGPLVDMVLRDWDRQALYLVGAGSVCRAVKDRFWGTPTLLGVDAIHGDGIVASDCNGPRLQVLVDDARRSRRPVFIVLSLIGGQGMLMGRGTQVFTPDVVRQVGWDHVIVAAPQEKLLGLDGLHVDTGDPVLDASAPKYMRVIAGWNETRLLRVHRPQDVGKGDSG